MRAPQVVFVKNELNVEAVAQLEGFVGQDVVVQLAVETAPARWRSSIRSASAPTRTAIACR